MILNRLVTLPAVLLASGCAFVGPIADRGFRDAPYSACAELTDGNAPVAAVAQEAVKVGCFRLVARTLSGYGGPAAVAQGFTPAGLVVTDRASFSLDASEGCKGVFTNFIVEYSAPAGAKAQLVATNALGTVTGMDEIQADPSSKVHRTVMREMGDPLKDPAVLEISDVRGELVVRSVCLKGY